MKQSLIPIRAIDWQRLTRFASDITIAATGKACVVRPGCKDGSWGSQGYDGRFWEIELSMAMPRAEVCRTFMHELGHCVNQHVKKTIAAGGLGLRSVEYVEDAGFRDKVKARLHTIEREADRFADLAQIAFMQELGAAWVNWPFVDGEGEGYGTQE